MTTEHLHQVSLLQEAILTKYHDLRGHDLDARSTRKLHREFVMEEDLHENLIRQAYDVSALASENHDRISGLRVLLHVRDGLIAGGERVRRMKIKHYQPRLYTLLNVKEDLSRTTRYKDILKSQVSLLQMVGAEMEAIALVLYIDRKFPSGLELIDDDGFDLTGFLKLTNGVDIILNDLRAMTIS